MWGFTQFYFIERKCPLDHFLGYLGCLLLQRCLCGELTVESEDAAFQEACSECQVHGIRPPVSANEAQLHYPCSNEARLI